MLCFSRGLPRVSQHALAGDDRWTIKELLEKKFVAESLQKLTTSNQKTTFMDAVEKLRGFADSVDEQHVSADTTKRMSQFVRQESSLASRQKSVDSKSRALLGTAKTKETEIEAGKWPAGGSKRMREDALAGTVEFMDGVIAKIQGINNNSLKYGSLSSREMKLVAAHLPTVIYMDTKAHRSCNLASLKLDHVEQIMTVETGEDGCGFLAMVEQKTRCAKKTTFFPVTPLLKRELSRYTDHIRPFLSRRGQRPNTVTLVEEADLAHFTEVLQLGDDAWFLKQSKNKELHSSRKAKPARQRSRPAEIFEHHGPEGKLFNN
jgi:hypothetical protein